MTVQEIYDGSDGEATKALYRELEALGPIGIIAVNLFRAHKTSARAKMYGRSKYRGMSYDKKDWSLNNLVSALVEHGTSLGITFGWKQDPNTPGYEWVLYVDLPTGQASFHTSHRGEGPDYTLEWDGEKRSGSRIIQFCEELREKKSHFVQAGI